MGSRGYYERPVGTWILSARYSLERTTSSILVPTGYVLLERECYLRVPYERYSSNLTAFRRVLFLSDINAIGFLILEDGHFSLCVDRLEWCFFSRTRCGVPLQRTLCQFYPGSSKVHDSSTTMYFVSKKCLNRRRRWGSEAVGSPRTIIFKGMRSLMSTNGSPRSPASLGTAALVDPRTLPRVCVGEEEDRGPFRLRSCSVILIFTFLQTYEDWALPCHHSTEVELQPDETCFYPYQDYCLDNRQCVVQTKNKVIAFTDS